MDMSTYKLIHSLLSIVTYNNIIKQSKLTYIDTYIYTYTYVCMYVCMYVHRHVIHGPKQ